MANRAFIEKNYTLITREVTLYASLRLDGGAVPVLQQWNYPALGSGVATHNTYTEAPAPPAFATGSSYPLTTAGGSEGVRSVTWDLGNTLLTIKLQDNYQRVLAIECVTENATGDTTAVVVTKLPDTAGSLMSAKDGSEIAFKPSTASLTLGGFAASDLVHLKIVLADSTTP